MSSVTIGFLFTASKYINGGVIHLGKGNQWIHSRNLVCLFGEINKVCGAGYGVHIFAIPNRWIVNQQGSSRFYVWGSPNNLLPEVCNDLLFIKHSQRSCIVREDSQ